LKEKKGFFRVGVPNPPKRKKPYGQSSEQNPFPSRFETKKKERTPQEKRKPKHSSRGGGREAKVKKQKSEKKRKNISPFGKGRKGGSQGERPRGGLDRKKQICERKGVIAKKKKKRGSIGGRRRKNRGRISNIAVGSESGPKKQGKWNRS